jgi:acyl-CoA thioester hydrolase
MEIRVRYAECDPMGVAHHSAYAPWFEMGRTELLRRDGIAYRDLEEVGVRLAVVSLGIKFRKPARYDDVVRVVTTLTSASHVKIEHEYELWREHEKLATAQTTLACLTDAGKAIELPPMLRAHTDGDCCHA